MTEPIDWPRLLGDLAYLGLTGRDLSRASGAGQDAVKKWAKGGKPSSQAGAALERLWCNMTGKHARFLPRLSPGALPLRGEVPNLDSDEDQELAYVQIEALQNVWARILPNH